MQKHNCYLRKIIKRYNKVRVTDWDCECMSSSDCIAAVASTHTQLTECSDQGNWWHDRSPPLTAVLHGAGTQVPE